MKGSDTMVVLGQRWAEEYMKAHKDTTIQIQGGGSGTGHQRAHQRHDRHLRGVARHEGRREEAGPGEVRRPPVEMVVAKDGLSVYVNATQPLKELSMPQLKEIFTGKITNWKDVGGADAKIIVYSRENSSGTYVFFKEHVLENADYTPRAQTLPGTAAVVNAVVEGQERHRLRRRRLRQGPEDPEGQEGRQGARPSSPTARPSRTGRTRCRGRCSSTCATTCRPTEKGVHRLGPLARGQAMVEKVGYFPIK